MLCVLAKLDTDATNRLNALRKTALAGQCPAKPIYGHITLATYLGADDARFIRFCRQQLIGMTAFSVPYRTLAVLDATSVIVALPEKTERLVRLNKCFAEAFPNDLDRWTQPDCWIPHTTLYYDSNADLPAICRAMQRRFEPFIAEVCSICFSRVTEDGYEIADTAELLKGETNGVQ